MPAAIHSDSELSEFLLRACHDLRGPLRTIRIHSELLSRAREGSDRVREGSSRVGDGSEQSLAFVQNSAVTAGVLVDGITDYALALAINESRFQPTPLDVMLRSVMAKLASQIRESAAEVTYGELPTVRGDADRLLQLFEYLLDNALRRRGSNRPAIRIDAELENGAWLFTFRDDCTGIEAESLERAFTPFARMYGNQRPGPGLAICRAIVERHGGKMWAEPDADGCVIRFTLPEG